MTPALRHHPLRRQAPQRPGRGRCPGSLGSKTPVALLVVTSCLWAHGASAANVTVVDQSSYVPYAVSASGAPTGTLTSNSFTVSGPGTVTVTLTDIGWPQALASLSFQLQGPGVSAADKMSGAGTMTFDVASAGTYFALAYATALPQNGALIGGGDIGLRVSYCAAASPVPLPGSGWLLLSALGFAGVGLRRMPSLEANGRRGARLPDGRPLAA